MIADSWEDAVVVDVVIDINIAERAVIVILPTISESPQGSPKEYRHLQITRMRGLGLYGIRVWSTMNEDDGREGIRCK